MFYYFPWTLQLKDLQWSKMYCQNAFGIVRFENHNHQRSCGTIFSGSQLSYGRYLGVHGRYRALLRGSEGNAPGTFQNFHEAPVTLLKLAVSPPELSEILPKPTWNPVGSRIWDSPKPQNTMSLNPPKSSETLKNASKISLKPHVTNLRGSSTSTT